MPRATDIERLYDEHAQPLHCWRTDDGQFVLYSVGSNETDDGGVLALKNSSSKVDIS